MWSHKKNSLIGYLLYGIGWTMTLWDLYETILAAGDSPYRLHHGYYGLALLILALLLIDWNHIKVYLMDLRRIK